MFKKLLLLFLFFATMLFADQAVGEPTKANRVNVAQLYVAYFDRAPDSGGLDYWVDDSGLSLEEISSSFFDQEETKEKYPIGFTNSQFIDEVYKNLFNRPPDKVGKAYWLVELDAERIPRSLFILAVINGAQGTDATILQNKTIVGLAFAEAGLEDAKDAECVLSGITDDMDTLKEGLEIVDILADGGECNWDNTKPIADAGEDQIVKIGDKVTLDGSDSLDPENDNLTYKWTLEEKPADSDAKLVDDTKEKSTFIADVNGTYRAQLIVNDGRVDSDPDDVNVTAKEEIDCTPVAVIRGTRNDNNATDQNLTGEDSIKPCSDTGALEYDWDIANQPGGATIVTDNDVNATLDGMDMNGTYKVELIVRTDDSGTILFSQPVYRSINYTGEE